MQDQKNNRHIIIIHILTYGSRGLILPFIHIYLKEKGFTGTEIGLLVGIGAFIQLSLTPILTTIADRTAKHRSLLIQLLVANTLAMTAVILAISKLWLGGAVLIRDTADRPVEPLLSQLTITWLVQQKQNIYGKIRAWGSLGWGISTLVAGRIFALGGYPLLFSVAVAINIAAIPFMWSLPEQTTAPQKAGEDAVKPIPRTIGFYILLSSLFLFFMGLNASYTFMYIYFKDTLGANNEMIGILAAVAALSEIPSMMMIDALLRRIDIRMTLASGILGMTTLWVVFSSLTGTFFLIPLMLVRGTFYTFQSISRTLLISHISDPANVSTNQSLAFVTIPGLATVLTGPLAGWIFDEYGARTLFRITGIIGVLATLIIIIGWRHLDPAKRS